ncbi:hypothetical protein [Burkholderia gladioli]|uniref:hypothetical protein n=1 Tax=Burkholderia gladioli TaxID=28095 RepID=UPI00163E5940|nr:hypothetical protein [Burkholderia gladioli]
MVQRSPFLDVTPSQSATYVRSLGRFAMAQIRLSRANPDAAGELHGELLAAANHVQIAVDEPLTIADLVRAIHKESPPCQIYESWAACVLSAALIAARQMNVLCRDALMVAIDAPELREAAAGQCAAIAEARMALYGDESDNADGPDCDDDEYYDPSRLENELDDIDYGDAH